VAGADLNTCLLPEIVVSLGAVPVAPYATPSTDDLPLSLEPFVRQSDVVMLARHGSLTMGSDLSTAFKLLEKLEQAAHISYLAMAIGGAVEFPAGELERLRGLRDFYGIRTHQIACSANATGKCPYDVAGTKDNLPADHQMSDEETRRLIDVIAERVVAELHRRGG